MSHIKIEDNAEGFQYSPINKIEEYICGENVRKILKRITCAALKLSILIYCVVFIVFPLVYKYSYSIQRNMIFLNFVNLPNNPNYSNPVKYGLDGVRNMYLTTDDEITLGVWHILPEALLNDTNEEISSDDAFAKGHDVVVYSHGNSGNRAASHRIELYKILRKQFHVVAFDYRSYGDSTKIEPSEKGLVDDCKFIYKWVSNRTSANIFLWGHSLGTGVSTHALAVLERDNMRPTGLILESPFNNLKDEITEHPASMLFKNLPWFYYTIVEPMQNNNLTFTTDKYILLVDCPILILHAEDDRVVPYKLGYKLYQSALEHRKGSQGTVHFYGFPRKFGYGHKYICRAPDLFTTIEKFVTEATKESHDKHL